MKRQKVLWIAPFPLSYLDSSYSSHPAPWITELHLEVSAFFDLTIVSFSKDISNELSFSRHGVKYIFYPLPRLLKDFLLLFRGNLIAMKKVRRLIGLESFDLIHIHGTEHQYFSGLNCLNIPVIISIQGFISEVLPFLPFRSLNYVRWSLLRKFEIGEIRTSKNFICRTNWDKSIVRKYNSDASIFHNWELIRTDFYVEGGSHDSFELLFLGGLSTLKGVRETLKAFSLLLKKDSRYTLNIFGFGSNEQLLCLLEKLALSQIARSVICHGQVSSNVIVKYLVRSFCLIHPSYIDNSPNSVCEAQISGIPVVATDVGGVPSLVVDKETGILVSRYSYDDIFNAVIRLKEDLEMYCYISSESRKVSRIRHNREVIVSETNGLYRQLINSK